MVKPVRNLSHLDWRPHMVYELYDDKENALYVGMTYDLPARLRTHSRMPWWRDVAEVRAVRRHDRGEARVREKLRLAELQPLWNIQDTEAAVEVARAGHRKRRQREAERA